MPRYTRQDGPPSATAGSGALASVLGTLPLIGCRRGQKSGILQRYENQRKENHATEKDTQQTEAETQDPAR